MGELDSALLAVSVASPFVDKDDAGKAISYRQII